MAARAPRSKFTRGRVRSRRRVGSSIDNMPGSGQRQIERKGGAMADLIAIGYPDEATAQAAADEARRLAKDLIIQPDAIAVVSRDSDGSYHVSTNHHMVRSEERRVGKECRS